MTPEQRGDKEAVAIGEREVRWWWQKWVRGRRGGREVAGTEKGWEIED